MRTRRSRNQRLSGKPRIAPGDLEMPPDPAPFPSDDKLIEAADMMFTARELASAGDLEMDDAERVTIPMLESMWTTYWHRSVALTKSKEVTLAHAMNSRRLDSVDREIVIALVMNRLGLLQEDLPTCKDLLAFLKVSSELRLKSLRATSEIGRLYRLGLLSHDEMDEDLRDRALVIDPELVEGVLDRKSGRDRSAPIKNEEEAYRHVMRLNQFLEQRSRILDHFHSNERTALFKANKSVERLFDSFQKALGLHPSWKLSALASKQYRLNREEMLIVLYIVGRDFDFLSTRFGDPSGAELARASAESVDEAMQNVLLLKPTGCLIARELIRPTGGSDSQLATDDRTIASAEYELTENALEIFGLQKSGNKLRGGKFKVRPPKVALDQLVLSDRVLNAIRMAVAQVQNSDVLLKDWGLGEIIPYGRGVTLLFWGPPGTGKTACAEAIAHALSREILVADYSKLMDCYVGNTGKNISRAFHEARHQNAVLFWDEADAMFYNRNSAVRNWEIQDANIILKELENFEGVCILATNRKIALDPALERRVSLKVEFERPNRAMRRKIWEKLLPPKLPLAEDLDLDALAEADLAGGEIKNAVLNAARSAMLNEISGPLTRQDFERAILQEVDGHWTCNNRRMIGFH